MARFVPSLLRHIPSGRLARNALLATGWQVIRVAGQTVWVISLARAVGPKSYGTFAGIAGLATATGALTGLGFGVLMLQETSRNHIRFAVAWKRARLVTLASGLSLWLLYIALAPRLFLNHADLLTYAAIGLPELICFPLIIVASYAFQAHERMGWAGGLYALVPAGNVIAVSTFLMSAPRPTLEGYLPFHALASILSAACAIILVRALLSPSAAKFSLDASDMREGLGFSLMRLADTGLTSLDKTLVLKLAGSEVAGIYSSAYRLVAVLAMPATSLGMAALPRLFRAHSESSDQYARLVRTLVGFTFAYGIVAAFAAWALSGTLPRLFGPTFGPAAQAARWLAPSPLLYGLYALGCNVLVTSGRRRLRVVAQIMGMALLLVLAVVLVPRFGLPGAVATLLIAQAGTALLLWSQVYLGRMSGRSESIAAK